MEGTWSPQAQLVFDLLDPVIRNLEKLAFVGEVTHFVKVPALDAQLAPTAQSLGMDLTMIKYTLSLFLVYPLAAVLYSLPNKHLKHFFSMAVGVIMVQWIFGSDWIHTFVSSLGTYLLCMILPGKYQARVVFVFVMSYMIMAHIYRMYVSYLSGVFDFTGTQMVLTMKLTSFAYNLYDGTYDAKRVFSDDHNPKDIKVYQQRRKFAIRKLPNLVEFFGYVYCFTCILAGPAFEYSDYAAAIDDSAYKQPSVSKDKAEDGKTSATIKRPSTLLPGLQRLVVGVVCMVGFLKLSAVYQLPTLHQVDFIASNPLQYRFVYMLIAMFAERLKYYFAWKIAEGASIVGGFGFEGYDENGKVKGWRGVENIDIVSFETSTCIQYFTRAWNKRTQGWLERYTYQRTNKSLLITYFVSSVWHGLYPGFFLVFLSMPLVTEVERLIRAKINPLIVPGYDGFNIKTYPNTTVAKIYWFVCWMHGYFLLNYFVQVFSMGSLARSLRALGSMYYSGHIMVVTAYLLLQLFSTPKTAKAKSEKQA